MKFGGEFSISAEPERVFSLITDPNFVCTKLPDVESYNIVDENNIQLKLKVGVGFIKGTMNFNFRIESKEPPLKASVVGKGSGVGSIVDILFEFNLTRLDPGTKVAWAASADMHGKIATIAGGMISPAVKKNAGRFIEAIKEAIEKSGTAGAS